MIQTLKIALTFSPISWQTNVDINYLIPGGYIVLPTFPLHGSFFSMKGLHHRGHCLAIKERKAKYLFIFIYLFISHLYTGVQTRSRPH